MSDTFCIYVTNDHRNPFTREIIEFMGANIIKFNDVGMLFKIIPYSDICPALKRLPAMAFQYKNSPHTEIVYGISAIKDKLYELQLAFLSDSEKRISKSIMRADKNSDGPIGDDSSGDLQKNVANYIKNRSKIPVDVNPTVDFAPKPTITERKDNIMIGGGPNGTDADVEMMRKFKQNQEPAFDP